MYQIKYCFHQVPAIIDPESNNTIVGINRIFACPHVTCDANLLSRFRETSGSQEGRRHNDCDSNKTSLRQKLVYKEETSVLYTKNPTSRTAVSLPRYLTPSDSHRPCPHAMRGCPYTGCPCTAQL